MSSHPGASRSGTPRSSVDVALAQISGPGIRRPLVAVA